MSSAKVFHAEKNVRNVTATEKKKTVYKNVLGSPFILKWPTIHTDLGQTVLTQILKALEPIGEYKKKCRAAKKDKKSKEAMDITIEQPDIYKRVHIGINEVTRFMEHNIENKRSNKNISSDRNPVIYICKREIKPLQLCQHLLYMAALAKVKLVPMPADSECRIGKVLGINRASVVLVEVMENNEEALRLTANDIPLIDAPWLNNALDQPATFKTNNMKLLKTTAPLMKRNQQQKQPKQDTPTLKRKADDQSTSSASSNVNKKSKQ